MIVSVILTGFSEVGNLGPEVIKFFFMLNSVEHEILNVHKYKDIKKSGFF